MSTPKKNSNIKKSTAVTTRPPKVVITIPTHAQESARKNAVLLEHIEAVMDEVERVLEDTKYESEEDRRNLLKGSLYHWLSQVFDDAQPGMNDLKTALETSQAIIERYQRKEKLLKDQEV